MSKLEELIQKLCPDGVQYAPLWTLTAWDKKFKSVEKHKQSKIKKYKYYLANELQQLESEEGTVKILTTNVSDLWANECDVKNDVINAEIVCIPWGGNPIVQYFNGKFITGDNRIATSLDTKVLDNKFLYYLLENNLDIIKSFYRGSGLKHPDMSKVLDMIIPVPPLEVQKEIVRLLDDFTAKTAELQAELNKEYEARKKQYEYYRDTLLNDEEATRKVTLQDVAQYSKTRISSSEVDATNYVGVDNLLQNKKGKVNSTHVPTSGNLTEFQSGDILIGNIRPYLQKIWLSDKTGGTNGDVLDIRPNQKLITPPFLYQVLASDRFFNYDMQNSKGAKMPRGNKEKVMEYSFALPTLERQREIVLLLNKFEIAFNDLQSELPVEIESRQKQYVFYRDKLLTFKKLNESEVN